MDLSFSLLMKLSAKVKNKFDIILMMTRKKIMPKILRLIK